MTPDSSHKRHWAIMRQEACMGRIQTLLLVKAKKELTKPNVKRVTMELDPVVAVKATAGPAVLKRYKEPMWQGEAIARFATEKLPGKNVTKPIFDDKSVMIDRYFLAFEHENGHTAIAIRPLLITFDAKDMNITISPSTNNVTLITKGDGYGQA